MVLHPSRLKLAGLLVGCAVFFAIGIGALRNHSPVVGWMCTLLFGVAFVVFVVQLLPGASYLRITPEGFEFCAIFRRSPLIRWGDVSEFRVAKLPPGGNRMVVFDWKTRPQGGVRKINRALAGATDGLPDNYGMKHQALADLMNERRSRALAGG